MLAYFFISKRKPDWRRSVVETPFSTLIIATCPLLWESLAIASAAASPPWELSELIAEASIEVFLRVVSTAITGIPAFTYWSIGLNRATSSVGAMRRALGLLASTDLTTGICSSKFQVVAPAHLRVTPSFLASWIAP